MKYQQNLSSAVESQFTEPDFQENPGEEKLDRTGLESGTFGLRGRSLTCAGAKIQSDFFSRKLVK